MSEKKIRVERDANSSSGFMANVMLLMFAQIAVKVLGLVYKLIITNIDGFGDTGLGYYSSGYQIYTVLLALSSIGISSVISKVVSERMAIGDRKGAQRVFKICIAFFGSIGFVLSFLLFFGADFLAATIYNVPDTSYVMRVLAPAIGFVSISAVLRGYFAGLNDMKPTSFSQIFEQILNCVLSILFVVLLIGQEPYIMAAGGNFSSTVAIWVTFIYMIIYYRKHRIVYDKTQVSPEDTKSNRELLRMILILSVPITVSSLVSVINPLIDTATVSRCIQNTYAFMFDSKEALETYAMSMTGILAKVDTLVNMPIAVNCAFSTALTPVVAASFMIKDYDTIKKRMDSSTLLTMVIVVPCMFGFIFLAGPILHLLYPNASDGAGVLILYAIAMLFTGLCQNFYGGLYGLGKNYIPAISLIVGGVLKLVLNFILFSYREIGIYGAGISSIICAIVTFAITYIAFTKSVQLKLEMGKMIYKPMIAGIVMGLCAFGINAGLSLIIRPRLATIIAILAAVVIYFILVLGLRILSKEEMLNLPMGGRLYRLGVKLHFYKD